jgi:hypothetical protein
MTRKKVDPTPPKMLEVKPVVLTAGEALRLSQAYQAVEYSERAFNDAKQRLVHILHGVFVERKLPEHYHSKPWFMDVDGDEVWLVPPESSVDG